MTRYGYTLMTEQSGQRELVRYARAAERAGFDFEVMSDHCFPWLDELRTCVTWKVNAELPGPSGFSRVAVVQIGDDGQEAFLDVARRQLLPALRGRLGPLGKMEVVSGQAGGRYTRSINGMVGAMVVVFVVVVAFVVFRDAVRSDVDTTVREVDYVQPAAFAQEQAGFEILAPPRLPEGWTSTSVRYTPGLDERWHLGMLTDEGRYVGVEQARASEDNLVEEHVDEEARRGEPVTVDGGRWTTWTDEGGDLALVRRGEEVTTLVVGHEVPLEELVAFAASLR